MVTGEDFLHLFRCELVPLDMEDVDIIPLKTGNRRSDIVSGCIYETLQRIRRARIERSLVMCTGTRLEAADIKLENAPRQRQPSDSHFLPEGLSLDEYERDIIREALRRAAGNKSQAARLLGLTRNALRYRLTQMGMEA